MKKLSKGFGLVGILVLLAIISVGSYVVVNKYVKTGEVSESNSAIDQARQAADLLEQRNQGMMEDGVGADTTAGLPRDEVLRGWKTYTNTKYGFEVKYPGGAAWMVTEEGDYSDRAQFSFSDNGLYDRLGVVIVKNKSLQDLEKSITDTFTQNSGFKVKETPVTISGLTGKELIVSDSVGVRDSQVLFQVGNNVFDFVLLDGSQPALFKSFYSSFKLKK